MGTNGNEESLFSENKRFLTAMEAALILGIHVNTLKNWRKKKIGPIPAVIGRRWKYTKKSIQDYIDEGINAYKAMGNE